jgi:organic radical activating enzyme
MNKRITLSLLNTCNEKCFYCDIPEATNFKKFVYNENIFRLIKKFESISFSGGEIGLLDEEDFIFLFDYFSDNKITVCTNGLFFEKGFYDLFHNKIDSIVYHILEENKIIDINDPMIDRDIIIHKKNIENVYNIISDNPGLNFYLKLAHLRTPDKSFIIDDYDTLNKFSNLKNIKNYEMIKEFSNMDNNFYNNILKFCNRYPYSSLIDLVDYKIKHCCTKHINNPEKILNEENIELLLNDKLFKNVSLKYCDNCNFVLSIKQDLLDKMFSILKDKKNV